MAFDPAILRETLKDLLLLPSVSEGLILSTCNRTEIYFFGSSTQDVIHWLSATKSLECNELEALVEIRQEIDCFRHAARVASGLESMVLGETQILGQLKLAFRTAQEVGALGPNLHRCFQSVFSLAKEIRTETNVGAHSISLAAAAVKVSKQIFSDLGRRSVLFVGAGEMITLCASHFSSVSSCKLGFANRSLENANSLALKYSGDFFGLDMISKKIAEFDIVVTCTASQIPLLGKGVFENSLRQRKHRPIAIFDLGVPRDVEEAVGSLDDIFLFSVDDLGKFVEVSLENRERAALQAESLIRLQAERFLNQYSSPRVISTVKLFRESGEKLVRQEVEKALVRLRGGADPEDILISMSSAIKQKFLDKPCRVINKFAVDDREAIASALATLFNLDESL